MNHRKDAFGHMIISYNGEKCSYGKFGCIESYSSINAIVNKINSKAKYGKLLINEKNYIGTLKSELQNNDSATEIVNQGGEILGIGISNLVRLLNPQLVILSGPHIMNFEHYYEKSIEIFHSINPMENKVIFSKVGRF